MTHPFWGKSIILRFSAAAIYKVIQLTLVLIFSFAEKNGTGIKILSLWWHISPMTLTPVSEYEVSVETEYPVGGTICLYIKFRTVWQREFFTFGFKFFSDC